jgi:hypothetical protein
MLVCPAFRKEFNQEQKRKEKEKRQRIINRQKKRAVKRIHLKRLAILFSQIAPQFVYCRIGICYQQATIPSASGLDIQYHTPD